MCASGFLRVMLQLLFCCFVIIPQAFHLFPYSYSCTLLFASAVPKVLWTIIVLLYACLKCFNYVTTVTVVLCYKCLLRMFWLDHYSYCITLCLPLVFQQCHYSYYVPLLCVSYFDCVVTVTVIVMFSACLKCFSCIETALVFLCYVCFQYFDCVVAVIVYFMCASGVATVLLQLLYYFVMCASGILSQVLYLCHYSYCIALLCYVVFRWFGCVASVVLLCYVCFRCSNCAATVLVFLCSACFMCSDSIVMAIVLLRACLRYLTVLVQLLCSFAICAHPWDKLACCWDVMQRVYSNSYMCFRCSDCVATDTVLHFYMHFRCSNCFNSCVILLFVDQVLLMLLCYFCYMFFRCFVCAATAQAATLHLTTMVTLSVTLRSAPCRPLCCTSMTTLMVEPPTLWMSSKICSWYFSIFHPNGHCLTWAWWDRFSFCLWILGT